MEPKDLIPGTYYIHDRKHYVYICDTNKQLIDLSRGQILLPPDHPAVSLRAWQFLRPAMKSEVINVINQNDSLKENLLKKKVIINVNVLPPPSEHRWSGR